MTQATTINVDITPHPRILTILKDIEFTMLQCFCELIDNSIDGFLDALRSGSPIAEPTVTLGIGRETISVHDNGPGMSLERLERAVSAGWTSKDGTTSLGLYGMGFNIATAKLGGVTTIWTTRAGDAEWQGVTIDLAALARASSYQLPVRARRKDDPSHSGTEIEITSIKPEWSNKLTSAPIKNNITNPLGRIYKSMLREQDPHPIRFKLRVNGINVPAWEHCVWPETKTVTMKSTGEIIRATESFDRVFAKKYRSRVTGEVFDSPESLDPADVIEFEERVHGWIGVQRYLDNDDYGIDIIRNGRVIEMASKELFYWNGEDNIKRKEYPIDDPRDRGRFVGEIHLDHGYVFYTKKAFEKDHYSWNQLMLTVGSNEPLTKRADKSPNVSPLGKIFRAFRRSSPQRPATYSDILIVKDNEKAKAGVEGYRKGEQPYRDFGWWDQQLVASDKAEAPSTPDTPSVDIMGLGAGNASTDANPGMTSPNGATSPTSTTTAATSNGNGTDAAAVQPGIDRKHLRHLDMKVNGPTSDRVYKAAVYQVQSAEAERSLVGKPSASGVYEIELNTGHSVFQSSSFQVIDAVLAEFAHHVTQEENARGANSRVHFGDMLTVLRSQYRADNSLNPNRLSLDVSELVGRLQSALTSFLNEDQQGELLGILSPESVSRIKVAQARSRKSKSASAFLNLHDLAQVFAQRPELIMASGCFKDVWEPADILETAPLLEQYQADLRRRIGGVFDSLSGFAPRPEETSTPATLFYTRAAIDMLRELLA